MVNYVWNLNVAQQVSDFHPNYKFVTGFHLSFHCNLVLAWVTHGNVINYSNLSSANLNFIVSKCIGYHLLTDTHSVNKHMWYAAFTVI